MDRNSRTRGVTWLILLLYLGSSGLVFEHAGSVTAALPVCAARLLEKDRVLFECQQESCASAQPGQGLVGRHAEATVAQKQLADRDGASRVHCACACGICVVATCLYVPAESAGVSLPLEVHWAYLVLSERRTDFPTEELLRPPRSLV
ncbi:MAG: hypothetical protein H5U08_13940 [Thermogutta sp.]|uniref:hypothetical protein n=1 Tax=Thermogutta sp. TaxID=1962930 RepID=UPI0019C6E5F4|nr:hypothetical protein [Thermogutta sp.]MBC7353457.1 hypothetical protein [Thermogutta sp.]